MKHYGDITKLSGYDLPIVDVITGGSPCQDLSVAGKRQGIKHADKGDEETTRSGLFMDQIRIIKEMRENDKRLRGTDRSLRRPRFGIWENVPGAFSSPGGDRKGEDFAAVIEEFIKVAEPNAHVHVCVPDGGWPKAGCFYAVDLSWSLAWRQMDAQYWGVPQRRKRICLVADFNGPAAPDILFDPQLRRETEESESDETEPDAGDQPGRTLQPLGESLRGDFEPCEPEGQGAAERTSGGPDEASRVDELDDWCREVNASAKHQQDLIQHDQGIARSLAPGTHASGSHLTKTLVTGSPGGTSKDAPQSYTLKIRGSVEIDSAGKRAGKGPLVQTELSGTLGVSQDQTLIQPMKAQAVDVYNQTVDGETAATVTAACGGTNTSGPKVMSYGGMSDADPATYGFKPRNGSNAGSIGYEEEKSPTINTDENYAVLAYGFEPGAAKRLNPEDRFNAELAPTLRANMGDNQVGVASTRVYGISSYESNAMKSPNPHSGIYEADTARTLDLNGGSPACNQGGVLVFTQNQRDEREQ